MVGRAASPRFKVGDLVRLKSGGPTMTVSQVPTDEGYGPGTTYSCIWFSGAKDNRATFRPEVLEPAPAPAASPRPKKG